METDTSYEFFARCVCGLNVGFESMESEGAECEMDEILQGAGHESAPGIFFCNPISDVGGTEFAEDDLADIYAACDSLV